MKSPITAACCQFEPRFGDTAANIRRIEALIHEAQADLIVFPELCTSGYEFIDRAEVEKLALRPDGDHFKTILEAAAATNSHVIFGFPEDGGQGYYNSCALIRPSGQVTLYRKLHLFDREIELFDPGDAEPPVVDTPIGRIGMMICFDWIFPETARLAALKGAQILAHPSNLVLQYCQRAMFARSLENGIFTLTCNRIGSESRTGRTLTFTGASQILSNRGQALAEAAPDREEIIRAELNPQAADDKMITARNHILNDRRTEFYGGLVE